MVCRLKKNRLQCGIVAVCLWGYFLPGAGNYLAGYLAWMVVAIMLLMGAGIGFRRLAARIGAWKQNLATLTVTYGVATLAAWALGGLFFGGEGPVFTGMILVGSTSTTLSTCIMFTRLAGGDEALALWLSVTSSFFCVLLQPLLLAVFAGQALHLPAMMLVERLTLVLLLPLAAGMVLREALGDSRVAPFGGMITRACSFIILAVIMVAVAGGREFLGSLSSLPILAAVAALHLLLAWVSHLVSLVLGFSREDRIAVVFCGSQKTLQVPAYLAINVLGSPAAGLAPVLFHVFQLIFDSLLISRYSGQSGAGR